LGYLETPTLPCCISANGGLNHIALKGSNSRDRQIRKLVNEDHVVASSEERIPAACEVLSHAIRRLDDPRFSTCVRNFRPAKKIPGLYVPPSGCSGKKRPCNRIVQGLSR
jgi:hypothetical protein